MPKTKQPLDVHQQELVNVVKLTHTNLSVSRRMKTREIDRRFDIAKIELQRQFDEALERIRVEVEDEITAHERALDTALLAAYNGGIPIKRIAEDGFGNRYPGAVQALITKLRAEGLAGNTEGYQRNTTDELDTAPTIEFPKAVDVETILSDSTTVAAPSFAALGTLLRLVPDTDEFDVKAVQLTMDSRDPWFKQIAKNARPGTKNQHATTATLYLHPATGKLSVHESTEPGETYWDHPVARWVKDHPEEARTGFDAALAQ